MATSKTFRGGVWIMVGLAVMAPAVKGEQAPADPFSLVPADAWAVVVVKDLSALSSKVDGYAEQLGSGPIGLEGEWLRRVGLGTGVSTKQPTALVVMNKMQYGEQPFAALLPVADFEAVMKMTAAKVTETPGLYEGTNEEFGTCFVAKKSGYAIVAPTEALVKAILQSTEPMAKVSAGLAGSDVYVRVNLQPIIQQFKPLLMMAAMGMQMGGMGGMPGAGAPGTAEGGPATTGPGSPQAMQMQMQQNVGKIIGSVVTMLDELVGLDAGVVLAEKDVKLTMRLALKDGGELASIVAAQKPTDESLLKGLPGGPACTLAFGFQWVPKLGAFYNSVLEMAPPFAEAADRQKYIDATKAMAKMLYGEAVQMSLKPPVPGQGMLAVQVVAYVTDAKGYLDLFKAQMELQSKVSYPTGTGQSMTMPMTYEQNVATIAGVPVDRCNMNFMSMMNMPGMEGQAAQMQGIFAMLFGRPDGAISMRIAAVNDKTIVMDMTGDDVAMAKLITSAKSGSLALAANPKIAQASAKLAKRKLVECYVDVGKIINMVMMFTQGMAMMTGEGAATTMPTIDTPLIALSKTVVDGAVQVDLVLPVVVVAKIKGLAETMQGGPKTQGGGM